MSDYLISLNHSQTNNARKKSIDNQFLIVFNRET